MHLQTTKIRRNNKTYRYVQLVQSYRRKKDGKPTHRVIGNLGDLPAQTEENLKIALKASRESRALIIATDSPGLSDDSKVLANLRYLDIAVLLEMWNSWELDELFCGLIEEGESVINYAKVIAALTIQRCVAPKSKLFASRWISTTALPELLGIGVKPFNNTRIHRVLKAIHGCDVELQRRLPELYQSRSGAFAMSFMDVTNTYFEGHGCEMAERTRTKEGHRNKRAIGIVLLANEHGYPLRWDIVPGKTKDHLAMGEMLDDMRGIQWLGKTPVVLDRAMGRESTVRKLVGSGLRFLTAAPVNSIESHTKSLPHERFSGVVLGGTEDTYKQDIKSAARIAREAGMEEVDEHLFVLDLGVVDFEPSSNIGRKGQGQGYASFIKKRIRFARELRTKLDAGVYPNKRACAEAHGYNASWVSKMLRLLRLPLDLQERILALPDELRLTTQQLEPVLKEQDHDKQHEMLTAVLPIFRDSPASPVKDPDQPTIDGRHDSASDAMSIRLVAYFNPQMHVDQRVRAQEHRDELSRFITELNEELADARKSRAEEATRRKIRRELEKKDYVDVFEVSLVPITVTTRAGSRIDSFRCALTLKADAWAQRRRYDGFVLLLGHPKLDQSARELALMYRAKDAVEKDFQTIKSAIKLRPVYHYTNPKVQAHVTICMLALLLQRTLEHRLRDANMALTTPACMEILQTCHLNQMKPLPGGHCLYSVTEATTAQGEILKALKLSHLVNDRDVARTVTARVMPTKNSEAHVF